MNKFTELLLKLEVMDESFSKKESLERISKFSDVIGYHIIKALLFIDNDTYNKHCKDTDGFIEQCQDRYNSSKVKPSINEIYQSLIGVWDSELVIRRRLRDDFTDYSELPKRMKYNDARVLKTIILNTLHIITDWIKNNVKPNMKLIMDKYVEE